MNWFTDQIPDNFFSDPKQMALWGGLGNALVTGATPHPGTGMGAGNALLGLLGAGMGGATAGAGGAQQYKQSDTANQLSQMTLDWYKARQAAQDAANQQQQVPGSLAAGSPMMPGVAAKNAPGGMVGQVPMVGGLPNLPPGLANSMPAFINQQTKMLELNRGLGPDGSVQILPNALNAQGQLEYNKGQAAELGKQTAMTHDRPNGPQFGLQGIPGFGGVGSLPAYPGVPGSAPFGFNPASVVSSAIGDIKQDRAPPGMGPGDQAPPEIPQMDASALQMPPQVTSAPLPPPPTPGQMPAQNPVAAKAMRAAMPTAQDGKPYISGTSNLFKPDPSGVPKYDMSSFPDTNTGVAAGKKFAEEATATDIKANGSFTNEASSLQNEQFRLHELADVYKGIQSGTLTAQNPELANKLIAWGVIKDPQEIKNVAGVQKALMNHALQIIQQIKDTNSNLGGAPTRTFGSEIENLQEKGENPAEQPEALHQIISEATGIVNHHLDMVKGWDALGGLGNRAANGSTMRPDDYARRFIQSHEITDYKAMAEKAIGPFKGMPGNGGGSSSAAPQITWKRVNGKLVRQ